MIESYIYKITSEKYNIVLYTCKMCKYIKPPRNIYINDEIEQVAICCKCVKRKKWILHK